MLKPVKTQIHLSGSKSITQRALLCNYLSGNKGRVIKPLIADDTKFLQKALEKKLQGKIFLGNAGTAVRFLLPFAPVGATITGNKYMQKRPISDLLNALEGLGIKTESLNGCPPVKIISRNIINKEVTVDASKSSQYLSSLLMLAPTLKNGLTIKIKNKLVSRPYIDLTLDVLKQYGIKVENKNYKIFKIKHQKFKQINFKVEADSSSASYWQVYNYITGSKIEMPNLNLKSVQGDIKFIKALEKLKMGKTEFDFNKMPDMVMSMAVVSIFTNNKIKIKNIENLRIKETDRLKALNYNLNKLGIKNKIGKNYIIIQDNNKFVETRHGVSLQKITIKSFDDHRIAMAFGILGLKIDNPKCVSKSYPDFWRDYKKIKNANVVLTGMRGTGKTFFGAQWAKEWNMKFIDLDQEIERYAKMKVADIVSKNGWKYFRDLEYKITEKYSTSKNTVIATGGGTLMYKRNYNLLKNNYIILLVSEINDILKRIEKEKNRPALNGHDFIFELNEIWKQRKAKYYAVADNIVKS
ncbi:MAG: shikimate kinase [Patescibacteria group bacterium]